MLNIHNHLMLFRKDEEELLAYVNQICKEVSNKDHLVNAFLPESVRFRRLHKDIDNLKNQYPTTENRPPLFGLLVGVKDIFLVDGFPTKAGSKLPSSEFLGSEASIVTKLRKLGALILGKTVTTEFAYFAPGPTSNPHNLDHTPGGSSSGSAASVGAGMVPFALGSQTIGSIIRPASFCGVFGFKPSYDRVPMDGVIPLAPSLDTIGFFAQDQFTLSYISKYLINNIDCNQTPSHKPVLGIPSGPYMSIPNPEMLIHFSDVCDRLELAGYTILETPAFKDFGSIYKHHNNLVAYEASKTHSTWFSKYSHVYHLKTIELIEKGLSLSETDYKTALNSCISLRTELLEIQNQSGVDLWISPSARGAAPRGLSSTGDPIMNLPWTHCGSPVINVPAGFNWAGLPLGLQVAGRYSQDGFLLNWVEEIAECLKYPTQQ
jgi:Asp-tRNA(Asn)/Glu-tRNA(Gln) amidotransferase A subunit family amidase